MAALLSLAIVEGGADWLTAFLSVTAVVQTVLLAWLAKVPRWGAPGAMDMRQADREASAAGRRRRGVDG